MICSSKSRHKNNQDELNLAANLSKNAGPPHVHARYATDFFKNLLGVRPENIWSFETNVAAIADGIADLEALGLRGVKFVPVSRDEYFVGTPRRFDIIYVDACGPLPNDSQRTTRLVVDMFRHGALAPLGVLITNFSRPDISKSHTLDTYAALVAAYLYPKGFTESDPTLTPALSATRAVAKRCGQHRTEAGRIREI